jgi:hypothetical protein
MIDLKSRWSIFLVLIVVIILIIISTSLALGNYYQGISKSLSVKIEALQNSINMKNWYDANNDFSKIKNQWAENKKKWAMLIDHQEIDNIDISIERLESYIKSNSLSEALSESYALLRNITHIPKKEQVGIENILIYLKPLEIK